MPSKKKVHSAIDWLLSNVFYINPKSARVLNFVLTDFAYSSGEGAGNDQSFGVCMFFSQRQSLTEL